MREITTPMLDLCSESDLEGLFRGGGARQGRLGPLSRRATAREEGDRRRLSWLDRRPSGRRTLGAQRDR